MGDRGLVPLTLVGHVGQVRRRLEGHPAHVGAPDVVEKEVLRVRRPSWPATGTAAVTREAHGLARLGVSANGQLLTETIAQPGPRRVVAVPGLRRDDLHAHAPLACGHEGVGDVPVVEGPRGDPDGPVARPRGAEARPAPTPGAVDRLQHAAADRESLGTAAVGEAEVARGRDDVPLRRLARDFGSGFRLRLGSWAWVLGLVVFGLVVFGLVVFGLVVLRLGLHLVLGSRVGVRLLLLRLPHRGGRARERQHGCDQRNEAHHDRDEGAHGRMRAEVRPARGEGLEQERHLWIPTTRGVARTAHHEFIPICRRHAARIRRPCLRCVRGVSNG